MTLNGGMTAPIRAISAVAELLVAMFLRNCLGIGRLDVPVGRGVARGGHGCMSPVTVGQFLSQPRWCSLGFTYSAPGSRWGLPSHRPLVCPPK